MMHRRAGAMQQRVLMMMSTSALERYEYFLETYPELAERISQKLIASYLGITPQALSKLRRDRVMPDRS
jgi:CRP-like cAMP-binding protein